jgi:ferredoxin-type protein NapH
MARAAPAGNAPGMTPPMKNRQKIRRAALITSVALFPVTLYYMSPMLCLQGAASGILTGSVIVFLGQLVSALVLGRAFCGWACPAGGMQELLALARGRRIRRRIGWIKWLVWAPWLLALVFMLLRAGGVHAVDFTFQTTGGISVADRAGLIAMAIVLVVILVPALVIGRRASCHVLCWMAPFMVIGRKVALAVGLPGLRLRSEPSACTACGSCTAACPMSIDVAARAPSARVESADCTLCASCVDACPHAALSIGFGSIR